MKKLNKKAFTLIELLVVIAVVGILVLLGTPRFVGTVEKARETQIKNDVRAVESVITDQLSKENRFPWESTITYEELVDKLDEASLYGKTGTLSADIIEGDYIEIPPSYVEEMTGSKLDGVFYADYEGGILYLRDSETKYIYVSNARDLQNVRDNLDGNFIQTRDINLEGVSFEPLGNSSTSFTGAYDGGNYVIKGLEVKGEGKDYQGLFGHTSGATIRNVALEDINVTGANRVGGLVGLAVSSTEITNSYATGSVTGSGSIVGGLVGYTGSGVNISNSYATGEVTGSVEGRSDVGGLVGIAWTNSTIENSYATGEVTGHGHVGGLVGRSSSKISNSYATGSVKGSGSYVGGLVGVIGNSTIENSYATGEVTGSYAVGGLVGYANPKVTISISNSYAAGSVKGPGGVGGLVGFVEDNDRININSSYWDTVTTRQEKSDGGTGMTTEDMMKQTTYEGWDFVNVWKVDEGDYPKLR